MWASRWALLLLIPPVSQGKAILNHWATHQQVPAITPLSDAISKDLKKRGFTFVGSTILYAYLQAVSVVNDHLTSCHLHSNNAK